MKKKEPTRWQRIKSKYDDLFERESNLIGDHEELPTCNPFVFFLNRAIDYLDDRMNR